MRKILSFVTVFFLVLNLAGCFQSNTLVKVRPDGSGALEETFLMSKELIAQMKAMQEQMAGAMADGNNMQAKKGKGKDQAFGALNAEELKKKAKELGEGVTYVSSKKVTTDKFEGYKTIYAFKDINKLRFNQNPSGNVPGSQAAGKEADGKKEIIVFKFTKGKPSKLVIKMPEDKSVDKPEEFKGDIKKEQDANSEMMMMAQMKEMFGGMKISLAVEVMGSIERTNATHREGSKITLMEMDFGKLFEQQENLKKFSAQKPDTIEDAKKMMKDIPGIKVELNKEVTIDFR